MTAYIPYQILTAAELNASVDELSATIAAVATSVGAEAVARAAGDTAEAAARAAAIAVETTRALDAEATYHYGAWRAGCMGDGSTDDTANLMAAKAAARAAGRELRLVGLAGNTFKITSPITLVSGDQIIGAGTPNAVTGGTRGSILMATGNFAAVITAASVSNYRLEDFVINTNGTTTKALNLTGTSTTNAFCLLRNLLFVGSTANTLVYSSDSLVRFRDCVFYAGSTGTIQLQLDGNNLNTTVHDCIFIGGTGITINNTGAAGMISSEGIQIKNNIFANFNGAYNILVSGGAAYVTILGNVLDQAAGPAIIMSGAVKQITVQSNFLGQISAAGAVMDIDQTCTNIYILGNTFGNGKYNIIVGATTTARAGIIVIDNNNFGATTTACLSLDSVNNCRITNNMDNSTAVPSYQILKTNSAGGAYTFGHNSWSPQPITTFNDPTGSYTVMKDRGVTLSNAGVATAASGTSLVINHGLVTTPNKIHVTLQNGALTTFGVGSVGATSFTVSWAVSGAQQINWAAEI